MNHASSDGVRSYFLAGDIDIAVDDEYLLSSSSVSVEGYVLILFPLHFNKYRNYSIGKTKLNTKRILIWTYSLYLVY